MLRTSSQPGLKSCNSSCKPCTPAMDISYKSWCLAAFRKTHWIYHWKILKVYQCILMIPEYYDPMILCDVDSTLWPGHPIPFRRQYKLYFWPLFNKKTLRLIQNTLVCTTNLYLSNICWSSLWGWTRTDKTSKQSPWAQAEQTRVGPAFCDAHLPYRTWARTCKVTGNTKHNSWQETSKRQTRNTESHHHTSVLINIQLLIEVAEILTSWCVNSLC